MYSWQNVLENECLLINPLFLQWNLQQMIELYHGRDCNVMLGLTIVCIYKYAIVWVTLQTPTFVQTVAILTDVMYIHNSSSIQVFLPMNAYQNLDESTTLWSTVLCTHANCMSSQSCTKEGTCLFNTNERTVFVFLRVIYTMWIAYRVVAMILSSFLNVGIHSKLNCKL